MGVSEPRLIFAFEGPYEVYVCDSVQAAEGQFEAIDVDNNEYVFFGDDGEVIRGRTRDGLVVLAPTSEKRPAELRNRLRTYLVHPGVQLDADLADDPVALGRILLQRQRDRQWPRWPGWLHRLVHRG